MGASANDALLLLTGQLGGEIVNDTAARVGSWRRLSVLANVTGATVVLNGVTTASLALTAGTDLFGEITAVTLGAGSVALYK